MLDVDDVPIFADFPLGFRRCENIFVCILQLR